MNIAIIGLGLLGGSYAKAISTRTRHSVYALTRNEETINKAVHDKAILKAIDKSELCDMDYVIVALPPNATVSFIKENLKHMKKDAILTDVVGVKTAIKNAVGELAKKYGVNYVGTHPMAGREVSGYDNALSSLFDNRSLIIMNDNDISEDVLKTVENLNASLGFSKIVYTTSEHHDRIISYTSQLCHVTSKAYVKSPSSREHRGFSGGSFEDLTRVAYLDPKLWIELFSLNKDNLLKELTLYIEELKKYQEALKQNDFDGLEKLLAQGRDIKKEISK